MIRHYFKGSHYWSMPGSLHPQYSIECFDGDEAPFREKGPGYTFVTDERVEGATPNEVVMLVATP